MKLKMICLLIVVSLIVALNGTTEGFSVNGEPTLWKNFNWEVGTGYFGGEAGKLYFRTPTAEYYTKELGYVKYDPLNPTHRLFSDLTIIRPDSLLPGEDAWGLFEMRQLESGEVIPTGAFDAPFGEIGPQSPANIYWNAGDNGEWVRGLFYGVQDQVVQVLSTSAFGNDVRIWSSNMNYYMSLMDNPTWDPQMAVNPTPDLITANGDRTDGTPWLIETKDWNASGTVVMEGIGEYFRFSGFIDAAGIPEGDNTTYADLFDIDGDGLVGDPSISDWMVNWWDNYFPDNYPVNWLWNDRTNPGYSAIKQTWKIGQPVSYANGWIGSEDTAKTYLVPEPVTMLGMFLGIGGLTGYVRKRRMA